MGAQHPDQCPYCPAHRSTYDGCWGRHIGGHLRAQNMGKEKLADAATKANDSRGEEGRKVAAQKALETMGKEGRSARAKKAHETLGVEGRSARAKKGKRNMGRKRRVAASQKAMRTMGEDGLSARAQKGNDSRVATMKRRRTEEPERWEEAIEGQKGKKRPKHSKTMRDNALKNKTGFRDRWDMKRGKVYALINLTPGRKGYKVGVSVKGSAETRARAIEGKGYGGWCLGRRQAGKHHDRLSVLLEFDCNFPYRVEHDIITQFEHDGEVVFTDEGSLRKAFSKAIKKHTVGDPFGNPPDSV